MPQWRISQAAQLLAVSDDTIRRWIDTGRLETVDDPGGPTGPTQVDGASLAALAEQIAAAPAGAHPVAESARNRLTGVVTRVTKDGVMAQVDLQCGPFRVVSLMSAEAATELELEPGALAVAGIKATNVVLEVPE